MFLGTDPENASGFISDLDLSSISEEAIKAACPGDYDEIVKQMENEEWVMVCDHHLEAAWMSFSYILCAQGTALFMAEDLLGASTYMERRRKGLAKSDHTFQHEPCHDFESLIWVVVYAMMIHHNNSLALTDLEGCDEYKRDMDECWGGLGCTLYPSHIYTIMTGCKARSQYLVELWFPDPREAAFFRDAMRSILDRGSTGEPITYECISTLFKKHVQLAMEPQDFDVVSK